MNLDNLTSSETAELARLLGKCGVGGRADAQSDQQEEIPWTTPVNEDRQDVLDVLRRRDATATDGENHRLSSAWPGVTFKFSKYFVHPNPATFKNPWRYQYHRDSAPSAENRHAAADLLLRLAEVLERIGGSIEGSTDTEEAAAVSAAIVAIATGGVSAGETYFSRHARRARRIRELFPSPAPDSTS